MASKKRKTPEHRTLGVRKRAGEAGVELTVDPRVVPVENRKRKIADQVIGARYVTVKRMDVEGTWCFVLTARDDELLDLSASMLWQKVKLTREERDGSSADINPPTLSYTVKKDVDGNVLYDASDGTVSREVKLEGEIVSPCALLGLAMWKSIKCSMNNVVVSEDNRGHTPWSLPTTTTSSSLDSSLLIPDTAGKQLKPDGNYQTNPWIGDNLGHLNRYSPTASSTPFELYTPLSLIDCLHFLDTSCPTIPTGVELSLQFEQGEGALVLDATNVNSRYKVDLLEMELDLHYLKLAPSILGSYELSLGKQPFQAKIEHYDCEYQYMAAGESRVRKTFSGQLPPKIHMVLLKQTQYHGSFQEQLHYFHHFNLDELNVDWMDGSENLTIHYDWDCKLPHRSFWMHHQFERGVSRAGTSYLNPESFKHGFTILTVNTSGGHTYGGGVESSPRHGPVEFSWKFLTQLAQGIVILYFMPRSRMITIDRERRVSVV